MKKLSERIKAYRNQLHLSQEYVANYIGINRATVAQMELGNRKITAEELLKLSTLFGVSSDSLLNGEVVSKPSALFARSFENLSSSDQAEIMNLIRFKEMMRAQQDK